MPFFEGWKGKCIWQPFYYDGQCANYLRELNFRKVIHEPLDFFERVKDNKFMSKVDIIIDNPPYTSPETKEKVLRTLVETNKPFVMLLPIYTLNNTFLRDIMDMQLIQCIIPKKVFIRKTGKEELPFKYLVWFCYKVGLEKDLYFI
uniref:Uncharacterized protein n=1 Tax=Arcella intermedia TaxID=1963864 RepID=A0A6B2LLZ6_9EUKA